MSDVITAFSTFADNHWFLAFIVIWFVCQIAISPFRLINRVIRHRNIAKAGWPPAHLDGDGDKFWGSK